MWCQERLIQPSKVHQREAFPTKRPRKFLTITVVSFAWKILKKTKRLTFQRVGTLFVSVASWTGLKNPVTLAQSASANFIVWRSKTTKQSELKNLKEGDWIRQSTPQFLWDRPWFKQDPSICCKWLEYLKTSIVHHVSSKAWEAYKMSQTNLQEPMRDKFNKWWLKNLR